MDKSYKWYEGQGHRIKGQGQIYDFLEKKGFCYNVCTISRIDTKIAGRVNINKN